MLQESTYPCAREHSLQRSVAGELVVGSLDQCGRICMSFQVPLSLTRITVTPPKTKTKQKQKQKTTTKTARFSLSDKTKSFAFIENTVYSRIIVTVEYTVIRT